MKVAVLEKDGRVLVQEVHCADRFVLRLKGLLGRDSLAAGQAFYLAPCGGIHTFFMKFSLDLVFLSRSLQVVRVVRDVTPGRVVFGGRSAHGVLEMQAGWFPEGAVQEGDRLTLLLSNGPA